MSHRTTERQLGATIIESALLAMIAFAVFGCQMTSEPPITRESGVLRVGSDLSNAPFSFLGEAGTPAGLEVEMMKKIAAELGLQLEYVQFEFDELLDAVVAGKIDVACATMGVTEARAQRVNFSIPYFETSIAVVVRKGVGQPDSIESLAGVRITAGRGTTSEFAVREVLPNADLLFAEEKDAPVAERLIGGELDAAVMDGPNAVALAGEYSTLEVLAERLAAERYAIVIPKENRALKRKIDAAIGKLRKKDALPKIGREE